MNGKNEVSIAFKGFAESVSHARKDRSKLSVMGKAFQELLNAAEVHKRDISPAIGVDKATVDRWWSGTNAPNNGTVEQLRKFFLVPLSAVEECSLNSLELLDPRYTPLLEVILEDLKTEKPVITGNSLATIISVMRSGAGNFSHQVIRSFFGMQ